MEEYIKHGGLLWWLVAISISLISLLYLDVWAFHNSNVRAFIVSTIFMLFIIIPFALDMKKHLIPSETNFTHCSISFTVGLILASIIGSLANIGGRQSVFGLFRVETQHLLSEISSQLPLFWSRFTDVVGASIGEELMFLITIPVILFSILFFVAEHTRLKFLEEAWIQIIIVIAITAPLFFWFHVGSVALVTFMIAAIVFRTVILGLVWGDVRTDLIPWLFLVPAFGVGFHMGNNIMSTGGWGSFFSIMVSELSTLPFGALIIGFIVINIVYPVFVILSEKEVISKIRSLRR